MKHTVESSESRPLLLLTRFIDACMRLICGSLQLAMVALQGLQIQTYD